VVLKSSTPDSVREVTVFVADEDKPEKYVQVNRETPKEPKKALSPSQLENVEFPELPKLPKFLVCRKRSWEPLYDCSSWSSWSNCSSECDAGFKTRMKICRSSFRDLIARQNLTSLEKCFNQVEREPCFNRRCSKTECNPAEWGPWSPCSGECSTLLSERKRQPGSAVLSEFCKKVQLPESRLCPKTEKC
uniref:TSP1_spondin domain-containing protein n=1 Tax=Macrostomum lignano TaxID=282301 RepID=A0A1I8JJD9_9PLAT